MSKKELSIGTIANLHGKVPLHVLPYHDVYVVVGNVTSLGTCWDFEQFMKWFEKLDCRHRILVPGEVDLCLEKFTGTTEQIITYYLSNKNNHLLIDESCTIEDVVFWGCPYTVSPYSALYYRDAFREETDNDLNVHFDRIPFDTDVLITTTPPYEILDKSKRPSAERIEASGSAYLRYLVAELNPRYHIFSARNDYGIVDIEGTTFVNPQIHLSWNEFRESPISLKIKK